MHFYLVSARFYQLAIGALLVSLPQALPSIKTSIVSFASFVCVLLLLLLPFKAQPFTLSVVVTCLTASLLYFYHNSLAFILENKVVQFIGKISYSLYLWYFAYLGLLTSLPLLHHSTCFSHVSLFVLQLLLII
jgi:peptidoglycan/LPS O-acetylase OafA/YrhL